MFIPHTDAERGAMLASLGMSSIDQLFSEIPKSVRFPKLNLTDRMTEPEIVSLLTELDHANLSTEGTPCFLGAGAYRHYIPAVLDNLTARGDFYTAYTPYQAEISQGTLQAIFEFQSLIARLTGMDAANASHYDGATACAEAGILAYHHFRGKRKKIVVSAGLHPHYLTTLRTYLQDFDGVQVVSPAQDVFEGAAGDAFLAAIDEDTSLVLAAYPDFYGTVVDLTPVADAAHAEGALFAACVNPIALGLLKTPGEMGADIAVGEGQPLGLGLNYGGPYLGIFAVKKPLLRKMSGRIVGETIDDRGQRAYVLTLTAREQHIRREKATSNICSNQGLNALRAGMYLAEIGADGLRSVARLCYDKAHYAAAQLDRLAGYRVLNTEPFFHEFVLQCPRPVESINQCLLDQEIIGGYDLSGVSPELGNAMLIAVTETTSKEDIDDFCHALKLEADHVHE